METATGHTVERRIVQCTGPTSTLIRTCFYYTLSLEQFQLGSFNFQRKHYSCPLNWAFSGVAQRLKLERCITDTVCVALSDILCWCPALQHQRSFHVPWTTNSNQKPLATVARNHQVERYWSQVAVLCTSHGKPTLRRKVLLKRKLDGCIVWSAHNTVFGSKRSDICATAELSYNIFFK